MRPLELDPSNDREVTYRAHFDAMRREHLKTLVTPEVIEEHRLSPLGQHSEPLERLLIYFRQQPNAGKYVIHAVKSYRDYRLVVLSGKRGVPPWALDDTSYKTVEEAYHALFLLFVHDLMKS